MKKFVIGISLVLLSVLAGCAVGFAPLPNGETDAVVGVSMGKVNAVVEKTSAAIAPVAQAAVESTPIGALIALATAAVGGIAGTVHYRTKQQTADTVWDQATAAAQGVPKVG